MTTINNIAFMSSAIAMRSVFLVAVMLLLIFVS